MNKPLVSFLKRGMRRMSLGKSLKLCGFSLSRQILVNFEANMKDISRRGGKSNL